MTGVSRVYLSLVSPAGIHNSRERAGSSTPLSRPMFPRSRFEGSTQDRGQEQFAEDLSAISTADARGSRTSNFLAEFRGHNKTTVSPAGRTAILSLLSLSLSLSLLSLPRLVLSSFVHQQFQLVVFLPSSWSPSFSPVKRKNQCDVTCALTTTGSFGVPTELSLSNPLYFEGKPNSSSQPVSAVANCTIILLEESRRRRNYKIDFTNFRFLRETRTRLSSMFQQNNSSFFDAKAKLISVDHRVSE